MMIGYFFKCHSEVATNMPNFYRDPIFVLLLIAPLPVWLWLYATKGVTGITDLSVLLSLVLLYPCVEEIIFRGFIQPFLAKRLHQRWSIFSLANVLTSLLFVLAHFICLLYTSPSPRDRG